MATCTNMRHLLSIALYLSLSLSAYATDILWVTCSTAFVEGKHYKDFIQATAIGNLEGGLFGDTRNDGYKFHEGLDIKSAKRDKSGHSQDEIYAAMEGKIALVNSNPAHSNYGKYIVIEHNTLDVCVYTLYAHLSKISPNIKENMQVQAGTFLGTMGGTPNISKALEHLHFEIGLRLSDKFQKWYDLQKFGSKNNMGNYNGMNLSGFDPLAFFEYAKAGKFTNMKSYIQNLPTAFVFRIYTKDTPDFVKRYPALVENDGSNLGWDIYFTWHGLIQKFESIKNPRIGARIGDCEIVKYNPDEVNRKCRKLISKNKDGSFSPTKELKDIIQKSF